MSLLRRLAEQVLQSADLASLADLLTRQAPADLSLEGATLLLWNRKLDTFETPSGGETLLRAGETGQTAAPPEARYLISDGALIETPGAQGHGVLVPLMARSGLVGMWTLAPAGHDPAPFRPAEARLFWSVASRAALAIENHLYQQELIASERMAALGTVASMLAHDFRGPLTVIRGYAELLQLQQAPADEVQERARLIVSMIDRLERMTAETLDFTREGRPLVRRTYRVASLLQDLAAGFAEELPGLEVDCDLQVPPDLSAILDVDKLRRALGNLAANARDAMGGHGRLHLRASIQGEEAGETALVLVVADEGPGVPAAIRDRVFEPFITQGKKGGTGLGLAVTRRFVEDHGGTVELLAEGPGARFRIVLPLRSASEETGRAPK